MAIYDRSGIVHDPHPHHTLVRRKSNWASHNVGVTLVFCIVFIIASGLIGLFLYRKMLARRARRAGNGWQDWDDFIYGFYGFELIDFNGFMDEMKIIGREEKRGDEMCDDGFWRFDDDER